MVFAYYTLENFIEDGFWVNRTIIEFLQDPANGGKQCYVSLEEGWRGRGLSFVSDSRYEFDPFYHRERISLLEDELSHMWMLILGIEHLWKEPSNPPSEEEDVELWD